MASTRRKSAAIALAVIGIAGLSLAAAAQLNITSTSLGAGSVTVVTCDAAVNLTYTLTGSNVSAVTVNGVDDVACLGQKIGLTAQNVTPTEQTVVAGTTAYTFTLSPVVAAKDLVDAAVIIH